MIEIDLKSDPAAFEEFLQRLRARESDTGSAVTSVVAAIIDDVRKRGDEALIEYTKKFDQVDLTGTPIRIDSETLRQTASLADNQLLIAIRESIRRVRLFHERQVETSWELQTSAGIRLGQRILPVERAGLYVPGGGASYPSSVIMNAVPAQVAGVKRIIVATPPRALAENPAIAATIVELGIEEVYGVGGSQAIAALAYGT